MKVLFVTHYSEMYGANRSLLALLDGLEQNGEIEPLVLLPGSGNLGKELNNRDIKCVKFPIKTWMAASSFKMPLRLAMNLIAIPYLLWEIQFSKIDLIYSNSSVTPVGAWLALLLRLPHIWHIREFGWEDYRLKYDLGRKVFEYWLNKADHVITVSEAIQKKVLEGVRTSSSVIYNGVISKEEAEKIIKQCRDNSDNKTIFGIIGLLSPAKGQAQAIKAFSVVNRNYLETELWIAGSGEREYERELKELCLSLNIAEKVFFLGYVDEPFDFFAKIDIVLVCSKSEGMGRVTAEAMVAGKPIIGLDNAGTSELIEDSWDGILYEDSTECLASKMEYSINNDLTDLAANARKKGLELFTVENYAMKVMNIMEKILQNWRT